MVVAEPETFPPSASGKLFFNQKYASGAVPPAVTVNEALFPAATLVAAGWPVMPGAVGAEEPVMVMVMFCESCALPGLTTQTVVG